MKKFIRFDSYGNRYVDIHTTATSQNGMRIRCDPYYPESGPWYDWAMFLWEEDGDSKSIRHAIPCVNVYSGHTDQEKRKFTHMGANLSNKPNVNDYREPMASNGQSSYFKELVTDLRQHVSSHDYTPVTPSHLDANEKVQVYCPAKVVGILSCTKTCKIHFIIHSCEYLCKTHSLIGRQWRLAYHPRNNNDQQKPRYDVVPAAALMCPCYVVEEFPGLFEYKPFTSTIVNEVFDRKVYWGKTFVDICKQGLHLVEFRNSGSQAPLISTTLNPKKPKSSRELSQQGKDATNQEGADRNDANTKKSEPPQKMKGRAQKSNDSNTVARAASKKHTDVPQGRTSAKTSEPSTKKTKASIPMAASKSTKKRPR